MNLIQNPEIQRRIQRGLVMKEPTPAPTLAPEIVGVCIVEDLLRPEQGIELRRPCWANAGVTAAALEFATVALFNPADSGTFIEIEAMMIRTAVAAVVQAIIDPAFSTAGFVQAGTVQFRDGRLIAGAALPVGQVWTDSAAALGVSAIVFPASTAPFAPFLFRVTLAPGNAAVFANQNPAGNVVVAFAWNETSSTR